MELEKILKSLEFIKELDLSYQERCSLGKMCFMKDGKNYLHNYGYREMIIAELLNLVKISGLHGVDTLSHELKSTTMTRRKDGKFRITKKTGLGELGRADKKNVSDNQDIIVSKFDDNDTPIISFIITNDENYRLWRDTKKLGKRDEMKDNKNIRDTVSIKYGDLENFNFEIKYWNNEENNVIIDSF